MWRVAQWEMWAFQNEQQQINQYVSYMLIVGLIAELWLMDDATKLAADVIRWQRNPEKKKIIIEREPQRNAHLVSLLLLCIAVSFWRCKLCVIYLDIDINNWESDHQCIHCEIYSKRKSIQRWCVKYDGEKKKKRKKIFQNPPVGWVDLHSWTVLMCQRFSMNQIVETGAFHHVFRKRVKKKKRKRNNKKIDGWWHFIFDYSLFFLGQNVNNFTDLKITTQCVSSAVICGRTGGTVTSPKVAYGRRFQQETESEWLCFKVLPNRASQPSKAMLKMQGGGGGGCWGGGGLTKYFPKLTSALEPNSCEGFVILWRCSRQGRWLCAQHWNCSLVNRLCVDWSTTGSQTSHFHADLGPQSLLLQFNRWCFFFNILCYYYIY